MSPISDLDTLLKSLEPVLNPGTYVFASLKAPREIDPQAVVACIREPEGTSLILAEADARRLGIDATFRCAWITLNVNSDLQSVGLTASFSQALAQAGISCNVVAGANHDHIFVPVELASRAMHTLQTLQANSAT